MAEGMTDPDAAGGTLPYGPTPVREWRDVDPGAFAEIVARNQPAVLRGAADRWPLVAQARRSPGALVEYLIAFDSGRLVTTALVAPGEKGRLAYKDELKALNHRHSSEKLPSVLKGLLRLLEDPDPPGVSIAALRAEENLPGLAEENRTGLVPAGTHPHLWIGNAVTVAPHFDAADNLAFVVAGRRRFTLFPPDQTANLYVGPFDVTPAGVPIGMVPQDAADLERYPRYREALAAAQVAQLEPGDAIYIPYLWWHGVQSLEGLNMLVNFWWYSDAVAAAHPQGVLLRAAYELFRDMPAEHRRAWRHLYDYWVFGAQGDPLEHLPPEQRTAPARLDPEAIARFKQAVVDLLS